MWHQLLQTESNTFLFFVEVENYHIELLVGLNDVEGEVNGLMTYDRKVVKMNEKKLNEINTKVIKSMPVK